MRSAIVIATVVLAIVLAPSALAAGNGPTKAVYDQKGKQVQNVVSVAGVTNTAAKQKPVATSATVTQGTLPFTGLDLGFAVAAGVGLVGMGIGLRRLTRKPDRSA